MKHINISNNLNTHYLYFGYEQVLLQPCDGRRYEVKQDISFGNWIIPSGYRTNGANVPRAFWWLIEPNQSNIMPAVIAHDFLCDIADESLKDQYYCNFKTADAVLHNHLKILKQHAWKVKLMYAAVRVFHWVKYERKWLNKRYNPKYSI